MIFAGNFFVKDPIRRIERLLSGEEPFRISQND